MSGFSPLRLVHPAALPARLKGAGVRVSFSLSGSPSSERLEVSFDVRAPSFRSNPGFSPDTSQWGLWDWDVVEVFLSVDGEGSCPPGRYFEFQVSPLNQFFELEVLEPRKTVRREFTCAWSRSSRVEGERWSASMSLPLRELGWEGRVEAIRGGAFAILGLPGERGYWALFLAPQDKPDFHLPAEFRPFFKP